MSSKRQATTDINRDNWDDEDTPEERGHFRTASEDELKTRVIKKARRKIAGTDVAADDEGSSEKKSVFSGFAGFGKAATTSSAASPFSFLSNVGGAKPTFSFGGANSGKKDEQSAVATSSSKLTFGSSSATKTNEEIKNGPSCSKNSFEASASALAKNDEQTGFASSSTKFSFGGSSAVKNDIQSNNASPSTKISFGVTSSTKKDEQSNNKVASSTFSLEASSVAAKKEEQHDSKSASSFSFVSANLTKKDEPINNKSLLNTFSFVPTPAVASASSAAKATTNTFSFSSGNTKKTEKPVTSTVTSSTVSPSQFTPKTNADEPQMKLERFSFGGAISETGINTSTNAPFTTTKSINNSYEGKSAAYYTKLQDLNQQISRWISTHVEQTPLCVLTPIFRDYENHLKKLDEEDICELTNESTKKKVVNLLNFERPSSTTTNYNIKMASNSSAPTSSPNRVANTAAKTSSPKVTTAIATVTSTFNFGLKPSPSTSPKNTFSFGGNAFKNSSNNAIGTASTTATTSASIFSLGGKASTESKATIAMASSSASSNATTATTAAANTLSFGYKPTSSAMVTSTASMFKFNTNPAESVEASKSSPKSNGFSFTAKAEEKPNLPSSTVFSFAKPADDKKPPPPAFSFTGATPFSFGNVAPPPPDFAASSSTSGKTDGAANEDDEDTPPKVEFKQVVEEDAVYSKKCKVFVKKDNEFADRGVGTLYLKPVKDSEKTQLIVRADTNLGNILVNIILSSAIPAKRMGKNNVMLVCIPTPDVEKPTPILLRVKTGDEADELLDIIQKNSK